MKKNDLEKRIGKILDEKETFLLSLILLVHMNGDDKYKDISELIFLFDNYNGFKQFIKYYEGQTIQVPTVKEVKRALRLLEMFQRVHIDERDFDESYDALKLWELGVTKEYCRNELELFNNYLKQEGTETLKQIKKLQKLK